MNQKITHLLIIPHVKLCINTKFLPFTPWGYLILSISNYAKHMLGPAIIVIMYFVINLNNITFTFNINFISEAVRAISQCSRVFFIWYYFAYKCNRNVFSFSIRTMCEMVIVLKGNVLSLKHL